jgi:DNA-binding XRE family transcriptional regulator
MTGPTFAVDGQRLRHWRRQRGMTQEKLADRAGISVATVVRLERQSGAACRGYTLGRLATAFSPQAAPGPQDAARREGPAS